MTKPTDLLTLAQAAAEVGLAPVTLRAYTNGQIEPLLPTTTIGRAKVVTRRDLDAWKVKRQNKAPENWG